MVLTYATALGKRQLERTERALFLQLLSERKLRAEAEFKLAQTPMVEAARPKPEDAASLFESVVGRAVGTGTESSTGEESSSQLELLADIGRREQWLLDETSLTVESRAPLLGVGGFGIVVPGRFL